jgi:hypothetical protein
MFLWSCFTVEFVSSPKEAHKIDRSGRMVDAP